MRFYDANPPEIQEFKQQTQSLMQEGLAHRNKQHWKQAVECFQKALDAYPQDKAAQLQIQRCQELETMKLPEDWDGAVSLDQK